MRTLIRVTSQGLLECVGELRLRVAKDDVDVLGRSGSVTQTQFECNSALDDELWRPGIGGTLEDTRQNPVRHPGANATFGDPEFARVGLGMPRHHAG